MKLLNKILTATGAIITLVATAQSGPPGLNNSASAVPLITNSSPVEMSEPQRFILSSDMSGITLEYDFKGFGVSNRIHNGITFNYIHIKDFSKMGEVGKPALPAHNDAIMLTGDGFTINILDTSFTEYHGYNIFPALEPASDEAGSPEPSFVMDNTVYSTNAFFPSSLVVLKEKQKIRGVDIGLFQIRPVQFNPVTGIIRVYSKIKYRIEFNGMSYDYQNLKSENSGNYLRNIRGSLLNADIVPKRSDISAKSSGACDIILLTTPAYLAAADTLAKWKRQMGYTVKVIASSSWTSASVKDTVHSLYQSWTPHPDYLTILGDHADVPADSIPYGSKYYLTDLYYVCMDGSGDYLADMAHGRISVGSAAEAMTVVQKIVNYERNPVTDASFYSNALMCTYFQDGYSYTSTHDGYADRRFLHTTEEIRSYLVSKNYTANRVYYAFDNRTPTNYNNGFYSTGQAIPSDLLVSNGFNWNGSTADIASNINAGKFLVFHRDHGYTDGYGWEHPYFLNQEASALVSNGNNINQLTNGDKLPVVFSINCHTGDFKRPECFAENFIRKANGGAVGVFAPSYSSYSGYNDALADGMIDAIWSNPGLVPAFGTGGTSNPNLNAHGDIYTMGDVLNQGLLRMTQTWASSTKWKMQCETYNYFGDPAMKIWTASPVTIAASGIDTLIRLDSSITVNTNCQSGMLTLMIDDTITAGAEIVNGTATVNFVVPGDCQAVLTITSHNYRPLIKNIHINNIIKQTPPSAQAKNVRFIADDGSKSSSITVEWDKGDGDFDLVKISDDGNFTAPVDGVEYAANNNYSGSGEQVVFSGSGTSVTVFNLNSGQTYWFRVYEYNNEGVYTLYQTITETDNPNTPDGDETLPVEITTFKATVVNGKVVLEWVTASETNNEKFIIEKSSGTDGFTVAGEVQGSGYSSIPVEYSFIDNSATSGIWYYKLVQVDFDGNMKSPAVVSVDVKNDYSLLYNVSQKSQNLVVTLGEINNETTVSLADMTGRIVFRKDIPPRWTGEKLLIPVAGLGEGLYIIVVQSAAGKEFKKIFIN
jgi:hypothetical protein